MSRLISNKPAAGPYLVRTKERVKPYINKGSVSSLTPKEILARKLGHNVKVGSVDISSASTGNFYSAQLSTDFLEKPQSLREKLELYRHFYNEDEIVGQAIDLHTELPLSKTRLVAPQPTTCPEGFKDPHDYGQYILSRFQRMSKKLKLFERLITTVHHYWLDGTVPLWAEDSQVSVPVEVGHKQQVVKSSYLTEDGETVEKEEVLWVPLKNRDALELAYYQKHYQGWSRLVVLPVNDVQITTNSFTDDFLVNLLPSEKDRDIVNRAVNGDPEAERIADKIPEEVKDCLLSGGAIPLGTDPSEGSFVYLLMGRKHADSERGQSILDRCLKTLIYRDKLRQAQTSIASRAMTPKRIVWGEQLNEQDVDDLRMQIDYALMDPDYTIVCNYEVHWEEMGSRDRLLDLSSEYEQTERRLLTGLGVSESLMSGESLFSGDRLKLESINTRYLHLREVIQTYVHEMLFEPVARRMGFVEKDRWGQEVVLYPTLSFTRLPLRDTQDTFDQLFNLYQKGSVTVDLILEMLNVDAEDTKLKLENDMMTVNDSAFNEVLRAVYSEAGRTLAERTNIVERIAGYMGLTYQNPPEEDSGGGRF